MRSIKVLLDQVERAKNLYSFDELKGSVTKGEGNIFGALGEIIIYDIYKSKGSIVDFNSTYDYDMIIDGHKVDIKSKKYTSRFTPSIKWNLNISDYNTNQKCDYYFFVGISDNLEVAYLYGYIKPELFYKVSAFNKKGEIDPNGNGIFRFKGDCHNINISQLEKFNYKKNKL